MSMKNKANKVPKRPKCQEDAGIVKGSNLILLSLYLLSTYPAFKGGSLIVQGHAYGWLVALAGVVYIALVYLIERLVNAKLNGME